jgi:hypothetical protein
MDVNGGRMGIDIVRRWSWGDRQHFEVGIYGKQVWVCAASGECSLSAYLSSRDAAKFLAGKFPLELRANRLALSADSSFTGGSHLLASVPLGDGGPSRDEIAAVIREAVATIRSQSTVGNAGRRSIL